MRASWGIELAATVRVDVASKASKSRWQMLALSEGPASLLRKLLMALRWTLEPVPH